MQIHCVVESTTEEWVVDPLRGPIKEKRRALQPASTERIVTPPGGFKSCPDGETFEVGPDGTFSLPDDVAEHFLRMPGWHEGASPFPPAEMTQEWEKRDPVVAKARGFVAPSR